MKNVLIKKNNSIQFHFSLDTFTIKVAIVSLQKKIRLRKVFKFFLNLVKKLPEQSDGGHGGLSG